MALDRRGECHRGVIRKQCLNLHAHFAGIIVCRIGGGLVGKWPVERKHEWSCEYIQELDLEVGGLFNGMQDAQEYAASRV